MRAKTPHSGKLLVFTLLSFVDLFLTWHLLGQGSGQFYESNPIARWWLEQHGWLGLLLFKTTVVLSVAGLALVISRYQPCTGGWVLAFACSVLALVVLYSSSLAGFMGRQFEVGSTQELEQHVATSRFLEKRIQDSRDYNRLLGRLSIDWLGDRCTLTEAVRQLAATPNAKNAKWLCMLHRRYPGRTTEQCLAACLLDAVVVSMTGNPTADWRRVHEMAVEYQATYGMHVPSGILPL